MTLGHAVVVADETQLDEAGFAEARRGGIGASDAGPVLGADGSYRTNVDVWRDKVGDATPFEGNRFTEWGHRLEGVVAEAFSEIAGVEIQPAHWILAHPDLQHVRANPDRAVVEHGQVGVYEGKIADSRVGHRWAGGQDDGDFPDAYHAQVQHQLLVTGLDFGYLAVLIGGNDLRWRRIEADLELHELMLEEYERFWWHVTHCTPPEPNGDPTGNKAALGALYGRGGNPEWTVPIDDLADTLRALDAAKQARKLTDDEIERLSNEVKARLGNATYGLVAGRKWAKWSRWTQDELDRQAIADEIGVTVDELKVRFSTSEPRSRLHIYKKEIRRGLPT